MIGDCGVDHTGMWSTPQSPLSAAGEEAAADGYGEVDGEG
jgi:hypothetical protein